MKNIVLIGNNIYLLICVIITFVVKQNELTLYENNDQYQMVLIDVNNDKIKDKIFYSKPYCGNKLVIFVNKNDRYIKSLESINFSEDGGMIIDDVVECKDNNVMIIKTFFPDRGVYNRHFYVAYRKNEWILTKVVSKKIDWQEDMSKTETSVTKKNIVLKTLKEDDSCLILLEEALNNDSAIYYTLYQFEHDLIHISRELMNKERSQISDVERYRQLFKKYPLKKSNVLYYNNIAFFLEQKELYLEAIFILENIIKLFPNRIVAYINLGDAYWLIGQKIKCKKNYQEYIDLMTKAGKISSIPKRVLERVKGEI